MKKSKVKTVERTNDNIMKIITSFWGASKNLTLLENDIIKTDKILVFGENPVLIKLPMTHGVEIIMPISTHQLLYIHSINTKNNIEKNIDILNKVQIDQTDKYVFFKVKPDNFDVLL